jgi:hypothetical protein
MLKAVATCAVVNPQSYITTFPLTENPLSESGNWVHVQDRTDFRSTGGVAYGLQSGSGPPGGTYDDSIMCLSSGTWTDVEIITTISVIGAVVDFCEIEHNHRCNAATGQYYEVNLARSGQYCNFYRAEGGVALADFTALATETGGVQFSVPGGAVNDGDSFRTRMVGDTLTAWINRNAGGGWVLIGSASDTSTSGHAKYSSGRPGIGAFISSTGSGPMSNYRLADFSAVAL